MLIYLLIILALVLSGSRFYIKAPNVGYISAAHTQAIKGIFILLIFASHFVTYVKLDGFLYASYYRIRVYLGQMVVAPFLFYSGYGIVEAIRKKGKSYLKTFPWNRMFKVYLQFAIATIMYLVLKYVQGSQYSLKDYLLIFTGYKSLGNGSWYVFAIILFYFFTWISFRLLNREDYALTAVTLLIVIYISVMRKFAPTRFFNTALCYVAGCWFSRYKPVFEKHVLVSRGKYAAALIGCAVAMLFVHQYWRVHLAFYLLVSILFALMIVLLSITVEIRNPVLSYCGKHLFSLYILHHIPMIILQKTSIASIWWIYFAVSLAIAFVLSWAFDRCFDKVWMYVQNVRSRKACEV